MELLDRFKKKLFTARVGEEKVEEEGEGGEKQVEEEKAKEEGDLW